MKSGKECGLHTIDVACGVYKLLFFMFCGASIFEVVEFVGDVMINDSYDFCQSVTCCAKFYR